MTVSSFVCMGSSNVRAHAVLQNMYGSYTTTDIDECGLGRDTCDPSSATCTNTIGSFECECVPGFTGDGVTCEGQEGTDDTSKSLRMCLLCTSTYVYIQTDEKDRQPQLYIPWSKPHPGPRLSHDPILLHQGLVEGKCLAIKAHVRIVCLYYDCEHHLVRIYY